MIGTKQMIVLTVLAEKIAIPCRFLRIFLNNEMIRQATGDSSLILPHSRMVFCE